MVAVRLLVFSLVFGSILALPDRDCQQIQNFVSHYTKFLHQVPLDAYPVNSFCSSPNSTLQYSAAVEWFQSAIGNESCALDFNHNRLNVIQKLYTHMTSIWEDAHCADCVSNVNDTMDFMQLYESHANCTKNYTNPCDVCAENYSKMQGFYGGLVHSRKGIVCFDIEDRMNQTRYAWSAKYNCCKGKQHSQKTFIGVASGICSLPIIFYIAMFFFVRRKEARELVAAPLLNDQATAEPEEEPPQPGTSQRQSPVQPKSLKDDVENDERIIDEPKINNLNITRGVRESRLIDLNDSGSENLHSEQDSKLSPVKDDVDDVSLLGAKDLLH